jgi:hypothetical protein
MIRKTAMIKEEWVIDLAGHEVPLSIIRDTTMPVLTIALIMIAYTIGMQNAEELVKWSNYKGCTANTGCYMVSSGIGIKWNCNDTKNESIINLNYTIPKRT